MVTLVICYYSVIATLKFLKRKEKRKTKAYTMKDSLNIIKKFWSERGRRVNLSQYYQESDYGWKIAIPTKEDGGNMLFTLIHYVEIDELSTKVSNSVLRKIARDLLPKLPIERHSWLIDNQIFIFTIKKILGKFMHARRESLAKGVNYYYFFSRLNRNQIKFRYYKIIGNILIGRAKGIVKSTKRKIKQEPYGYLKRMVDFLNKLGERLYQIGIRNIVWKKKHKEKRKEEIRENPKHLVAKEIIKLVKRVFGEETARNVGLVLDVYNVAKNDFG